MRVALRALEPRSTDSLGTQHCAKFESNTNRMTFEYAPNMMIVKVHPLKVITTFSKFSKWDSLIHADSLNSSTVVPFL